MYPVRLGYERARRRLNRLLEHGHCAEALVSSMATVEKTLRRTLRQLIVSTGFTSADAEKLVRKMHGLHNIKGQWALYDTRGRGLVEIIGNQQRGILKNCAKMRNNLFHGTQVYELKTCEREAKKVIAALDAIKECLEDTYGYSGWEKISGRKTRRLHLEPKVKV